MCIIVLKLQIKATQSGQPWLQSKLCRSRDSDQPSTQDSRVCCPATLCLEGPRSSWDPKPLRNSPDCLSSTISAQPSWSILSSLGICSSSLHKLCVWLIPWSLWTRDLVQCPVPHWKWLHVFLWVPGFSAVLTAVVTAAWMWGGIPVCVWVIQKQSYIQDAFPAAIHDKVVFFPII